MTSTKIYCVALMTKYISKTMDLMEWILFIRVNYKKSSYLKDCLEKVLCQAIKILF